MWPLDQLVKEWPMIKQAPLSFALVCLASCVGAVNATTYYAVQIKNSGAITVHRIRVEVDGFRGKDGTLNTGYYWQPSFKAESEVSLDPGETKKLGLLHSERDKGLLLVYPRYKSITLDSGRHDLTIRVFARDEPALTVRATLEVKPSGEAMLSPA
jgi:hypothetical protein